MCDVKRNSGLALLVAGAMGSGDGLFLCFSFSWFAGRKAGQVLEPPPPLPPVGIATSPPTAVLLFRVPLQALKHV